MSEQSDHDLLIEIKTTITLMAENQRKFETKLISEMTDIQGRVTALEVNRKGDSERFASISEQMQRTLNNAERITQAFTEIASVKADQNSGEENIRLEMKILSEDVKELKSKNSIFDWINFAVASIVGIISYILHGRPSP